MKISNEAIRISNWLRFTHCRPASHEDIKNGTGIDLGKNPKLTREGWTTGLFVWSDVFKGFI